MTAAAPPESATKQKNAKHYWEMTTTEIADVWPVTSQGQS
jgi:hypothetical protein